MITAAEIERTKGEILACTDRDALVLKIRFLAGKPEGLASATPMRSAAAAPFTADDVEAFVFDLEAMVEVLTVAAEQLRSLS